jgi:hypothetical protein
MFDLEQSIAEWRKQMLAAGIQPVPLEELESHLREEIERRVKSVMGAQEAFEITILKIGQPEELKTEFAKDGGIFGFLGDDKFTITNRVFGALWLAFCLLSFTLICRAMLFHPPLRHPGQITGFFIALSLLMAIYGTGIFGSIFLFRGAKWARHIIRTIAAFYLLCGTALAFRHFTLILGVFDSFYLVSVWFLFSPSYAKPSTVTK